MPPIRWGNTVVDLGFTFRYFSTEYTQVSISPYGYVCLGDKLDPTREGSGQIYYKRLDSNSLDFASAKIYLNLFNPDFEPQQIFMITYDNVLPYSSASTSMTSFQIYLSTDFVKSFVIFKFKSCPKDLKLQSSSGLNYKSGDGRLKEITIFDGQQCIGSNVGHTGVWVNDLNSKGQF